MCVRVCVRVCVRACVRVCVRACVYSIHGTFSKLGKSKFNANWWTFCLANVSVHTRVTHIHMHTHIIGLSILYLSTVYLLCGSVYILVTYIIANERF